MSLPKLIQPTPAPPVYLASIQYLRAVAATMIVLYHTRGALEHLGYAGGWAGGLSSGVDIFFVISGFVMWVSTSGRRMSPLEFYRRRVVRIVPLYWAMTALVVLTLLLLPGVVQSGRLLPSHVAASFLFLPALHPVTGLIQPLLIPGWTLNEEMYFYVIFGGCLLLPRLARIPAAWLCLLVPVVLCHVLAAPDVPLRFFGNGIVLDFGLGLALGGALGAGLHLPVVAALTLLVSGVLLLILVRAQHPYVVTVGLPALAIVAGLVGLERAGRLRSLPPLGLLGDASYSLYLSHGVTLSALAQMAHRGGIRASTLPAAWTLGVLLVLISLLVGVLVYRVMEQPLLSLFSRGGRSALRQRHAT